MIDVRRVGHVLVYLALALGSQTAAIAEGGPQQLVILGTTVDTESGSSPSTDFISARLA